MKTSYFVLIVGLIFSFQSFAEPLPADAAANMAELFFAQGHARIFKDLASSNFLNEVHNADFRRYVKSHQLENVALPLLEWKPGSSIITIRQGKKAYDMDFSKMPGHKQFVIDGKTISPQPNVTFEQMTDLIARTRGSRHAWELNLLESTAFASTAPDSMDFLTALAYYTGLDQLSACTGMENVAISTCKLRLNSSMILSNIEGGGESLADFKCEDGKFKSATIAFAGYRTTIMAGYDGKGEMASLKSSQDGFPTCNYELKDDKLVGMDVLGTKGGCDGRAEGSSDNESHEFRKGDVPRRLGNTVIPIQRVKECCKVPSCQKTVNEAVAKYRANQLPPTSNTGTVK